MGDGFDHGWKSETRVSTLSFPFVYFMARQVSYPKVQFPRILNGNKNALESYHEDVAQKEAQARFITIKAPLNSRGRHSHGACRNGATWSRADSDPAKSLVRTFIISFRVFMIQ